MDTPQTALILLGHGSHVSPNTAGIVWEQVDRCRALGVADEVTASFWKEQPSLHDVLLTVAAPEIFLLPLFTAQGYFTERAVPAEMDLQGPITRRNGQTLRYTPSLANHPMLLDVLTQRVRDTLAEFALPPDQTAVAIIGHGTRRSPESRHATEVGANLLRQTELAAEIVVAYLDDTPAIPDIYSLTSAPNLIVVPNFLAMGSHTTLDVPGELGLAHGQTQATLHGREVYYTRPIGTNDVLTDIILDIAHHAGLPKRPPAPDDSVWSRFPTVGSDAFLAAVESNGGMMFGELWVTPQRICHHLDRDRADLLRLTTPADLRQHLREKPFRPISGIANMPTGWMIEAPTPDRVPAIVESIYPGSIAAWASWQTGTLQPTSLAQLAARQTGIYTALKRLSPDATRRTVDQTCSACSKRPVWFSESDQQRIIPCPEPCNLWMGHALKRVDS